MMEVDQSVVSQVDKEVVPEETAGAVKPESSVASPDKIIEENDDLPALVISDSEGDETLAAEAEKDKVSKSRQDDGDISGVTPLNVSVIDVDAKDEDASKLEDAGKDSPQQAAEEVPKPPQNTVAEKQNKEPPNIYENIDLTGSSSADDSGVSDEGCEVSVKKVHENVAKVVKDSSQLTAQELLQSLLGLQQDAADEEARLNAEQSTEQREPKSGVEPQLDQGKEVSKPPESDRDGPQEQDESASMGDAKNAEEPERLRLSVNSPTAIAEDTDCVESDSKQTSESVTVAEAAKKDQGTKNPTPCDSQCSTSTSKDVHDDDDDDDDVVCLLEEMDDPIGINIDGEDDLLDGSISSSADIASTLVVGCEGQTKGNENVLLLESKDSEVDSIGEPPNKRSRSEGHHLDEGVTVEPLESRDNFEIVSIASAQHSHDNHACKTAGSEEKNSESRKAENSHQAESQPPVRSRPSSSIGDSMVPMESLSTADTDANAQVSAQTRPEETQSQYSDVLVIDDDEDDEVDDDINDAPAKTADKISSVGVEARLKRPRDADEPPECKEKSHPEDSSSVTLASSASTVQDSSVKRPKSMELPESKPLHMEFMKNMSKPIGSMSRDELEEIVLQKICQAMKYESELVEERKRGDKIVKAMQNLRQRLADMSKQYSDLKVVHDRVVLDLRRKANRFVQPVRITRAVGLQVNQPPQLSFQTFRASMETSTNAAANQSAEQSVIPADGNGSPGREGTSGSGPAGTMRDQTTNSAQGTSFVQRVADGFVGRQHPAPNVIRTSRPMNVTFVHGAKASAVTIKPTGSSRNNGTSVEGGPHGGSNSPSGSASSSFTGSTLSYRSATGGTPNGEGTGSPSSGVTARKKTVHKITPKRPPLSAVQQEEQDKMARQQQELFLQDMYNQQARMAKIVATSKGENSPPNVAEVRKQNAAGTTVTQIRTALAPPQASVPPQVSTASNVRANNRMAPFITNSMTLAGENQTAPASTITAPQQSHPSSAARNSLIDLTDEEESPRASSGGGAAPNPSAHNRQNDQNGTPAQPNTPTLSSQPPELVASNQMLKLSLVARQQSKHKMPQRILNGHVLQRPPATNATAASNLSVTKFGSMNPNRVQVFRPVLSKRPLGHMLSAGMSSLMNVQARYSGPLQTLYPVGAGQRAPIKLPNHLPPLPLPEKHNSHPQWKKSPPKPDIRINNVPTGIVISWSMPDLSTTYADIEKYQIYAYQETTELQATDAWRHVGDVNSLPLPMAVTLTHFNEGQRYHFAVRAIDQHRRSGFFSEPRTW